MTVSSVDKQQAARVQLEAALRLEVEGGQQAAVIALAGAAEEILGQMVKAGGAHNALTSLTDAAVAIHQHLYNETMPAKAFADRANRAKNSLKHHTPGDSHFVNVDLDEESIDLLDRAISNWWQLTTSISPAMQAFVRRQRAT